MSAELDKHFPVLIEPVYSLPYSQGPVTATVINQKNPVGTRFFQIGFSAVRPSVEAPLNLLVSLQIIF